MDKIKVAAIQMHNTENVDNNLELASNLIQQAAASSAVKLIVLPEMFPLGSHFDHKLKHKENYGHGRLQSFLSEHAKKHSLWIVGGSIPLEIIDPHRIRSACLVYNDQGINIARYDKMHLFDVSVNNRVYKESDLLEPGDHTVVVPTPFGNIGLAICYDIRFPEFFRALFNKKADIITIPAAFTEETGRAHWEVLCRARAIENQAFIIGAGQVGGSAERPVYGHSMIVNPWGTVLAELPQGSGIVVAEIDLEFQRELRLKMPVSSHQRIFLTNPPPCPPPASGSGVIS